MMSFPKLLALLATLLFGVIGIAAFLKGGKSPIAEKEIAGTPLEVELDEEIHMVSATSKPEKGLEEDPVKENPPVPEANRISEFFNKADPKLPIVQTIVYKSRVPWCKGRPAWLSDYALHYNTSRHFIARSLNGKPDYSKQDVSEGGRFNVFNPDKNFNFYLLVDSSRCKLWVYYVDLDTNERVLVQSYQVGLGRWDSSKASGMKTPLGKYSLGSKIASYKPKVMGYHNGQKVELLSVYGTRWLPFDKEISGATEPAAGLGLQGVPWVPGQKGELVEDLNSLGKYESDGCIYLATKDIEELYAIVITRPTNVEIVKDFYEATLPGIERIKE